MEAGPDAGVPPSSEVVIHGAPSWEFSGEETPLAAGAQQVENRIHYGTKIGCARASTSACCRQKWSNQHPGCIRQVRRIGFAWHPPVSRNTLILLTPTRDNFSNILLVPCGATVQFGETRLPHRANLWAC